MTSSSAVPLLKHPGPVAPNRRDVLAGRNQKTWRIVLPRHASLYEGVTVAMQTMQLRAASLNIERATFSHLRYFLITHTQGAEQVANYTTPVDVDEPTLLVGAGATVGTNGQGALAIHCHGLAVTQSGRLTGGHLLTEACTLAEDGVAYISALGHMDLVIGVDPEIRTPVFQPSYCEA